MRHLPLFRRPDINDVPSCLRSMADKQKYRQAVQNQTYNIALDDDAQVECHYMGKLNVECVHCAALYYEFERRSNYWPCCCNGKVPCRLPPSPEEFTRLFDGQTVETRANRRRLTLLNERLQLAALEMKSIAVLGAGPPVVKVQGQPRVMLHNPRPNANPNDLSTIDAANNSKLIGYLTGHNVILNSK